MANSTRVELLLVDGVDEEALRVLDRDRRRLVKGTHDVHAVVLETRVPRRVVVDVDNVIRVVDAESAREKERNVTSFFRR